MLTARMEVTEAAVAEAHALAKVEFWGERRRLQVEYDALLKVVDEQERDLRMASLRRQSERRVAEELARARDVLAQQLAEAKADVHGLRQKLATGKRVRRGRSGGA